MTSDGKVAQESGRVLKGTHTFLLLLALILLIAGSPFFVFGVFLALGPGQNGIGMDVAFRFSVGGLVSVLSALGIRAYLLRRDSWF